ncbi:MAG TPA: hypothetical protein VHG28_01695 [Longimicrobiaceae bacterium]|nr:hypothetical protein [Longimicrobiaceae bacterium]
MTFVLREDHVRRMAMEWHRQNPQFTIGILVAAEILRADDERALARVPGLIRIATGHGLFSKKDVVQFTGASLLAGGDISTAPAIRAALARKPEHEAAFMEKVMRWLGPAYWTHLGGKVRPFDERL